MPKVKTELLMPTSDVETVWDVVSAFDEYPKTMSSVIAVEFQERSESQAVTSWTVSLNDSELSWVERDVFEPHRRISFESIDGDLEVFRGEWLLEPVDGGVSVSFEVEFDLGIPSLAEVLDPIGADALRENSMSMLNAIRDKLK